MLQWYVLNTKPHKERQVASLLRTRKMEVYLPIVGVNPVNPRSARLRAYFPNYLFAHVDFDVVGLSEMRWIPGMRRLVEFGNQPAVVSDNLVLELKLRIAEISAAGGLMMDGLQAGDRIRIVDGPFVGYEGVFDARMTGKERVRVLLEMLAEYQEIRPHLPIHKKRDVRVVPLELNVGNIVKI